MQIRWKCVHLMQIRWKCMHFHENAGKCAHFQWKTLPSRVTFICKSWLVHKIHKFIYKVIPSILVKTKDYCIQLAKPQLDANWPEKPPPLLPFGEILCLNHVTWNNFTQPYFMHHRTSHWGTGRKGPPPHHSNQTGENFLDLIYPFHAISSNFGSAGRKAPPPQDEGKFFYTGSIHFRQFPATLVFVAEKPPPPQDEGKFFYTGSIHFRQFPAPLVFVAEKHPPPRMREHFFLQWIYSFQAISSNFGFCGRKKPPPQDEGNFFYTGSIHFRQFPATLDFVAEKPPPRMRENFLTLDLSISGNFQQLWILWQKGPPRMRENILTLDLSISGNFQQLWFLWQKSPPPQDEGKYSYTGSIHFRQFPATLDFVAEKPRPPPGWGKIFLHWIYPFQAISNNFGFCGGKAPPPPGMREKFFILDLSISGNFQQLWFLWQKSPPPRPTRSQTGEIFLHWIYPFQAISSNFGFCGRKAPLPPMRTFTAHGLPPVTKDYLLGEVTHLVGLSYIYIRKTYVDESPKQKWFKLKMHAFSPNLHKMRAFSI